MWDAKNLLVYIFVCLFPRCILGGAVEKCHQEDFYKPYIKLYRSLSGAPEIVQTTNGFMDLTQFTNKIICLNGPMVIYKSVTISDDLLPPNGNQSCKPGQNYPPGLHCNSSGSGSGIPPVTGPGGSSDASLCYHEAHVEVFNHKCRTLNKLPKNVMVKQRNGGSPSTHNHLEHIIESTKILGVYLLSFDSKDYTIPHLNHFGLSNFKYCPGSTSTTNSSHSFAVIGNKEKYAFCHIAMRTSVHETEIQLYMEKPETPQICTYSGDDDDDDKFDEMFKGKDPQLFNWSPCNINNEVTTPKPDFSKFDPFATFGRSRGIMASDHTKRVGATGRRSRPVNRCMHALVKENCTKLPVFEPCPDQNKTRNECDFLNFGEGYAPEDSDKEDDADLKTRKEVLNLINSIFGKICKQVPRGLPSTVSNILMLYSKGNPTTLSKGDTWKFLNSELKKCNSQAKPMKFHCEHIHKIGVGTKRRIKTKTHFYRKRRSPDDDDFFNNQPLPPPPPPTVPTTPPPTTPPPTKPPPTKPSPTKPPPTTPPPTKPPPTKPPPTKPPPTKPPPTTPPPTKPPPTKPPPTTPPPTKPSIIHTTPKTGRRVKLLALKTGEPRSLPRPVKEVDSWDPEEEFDLDGPCSASEVPINAKVEHENSTKRSLKVKTPLFYYREAVELEYTFNSALDVQWKVFATVAGYCNIFYTARKSETFPRLYNSYYEDFLAPVEDTWISSADNKALEVVVSELRSELVTTWLDSCMEASYIVSDSKTYRPARPLILTENGAEVANYFEDLPTESDFKTEDLPS